MTYEDFWLDQDILKIHKGIKDKNLKVVIPEGEDDRVINSLQYIKDIKLVLLGNKDLIVGKIVSKYSNFGEVMEKVEIIEEKDFEREELIQLFLEKRKGKLTEENARLLIKGANYFGTLLVENGDVDALVGGCKYSTADILKPAFQIIKAEEGTSTVSSCFIMKKDETRLVFGDCAVNIEPNKAQLKEITRQTINTALEMGIKPKVAMLSYSTKGSGTGPYAELVKSAYEELIQETPELEEIIDGELQFDAAFSQQVADVKCPNSKVAGQANVFIFPHINSGNIGYKMVQYLGGYEAVGPLLQGLRKPVNDLSRGTNAQTIAKVAYLALRKFK